MSSGCVSTVGPRPCNSCNKMLLYDPYDPHNPYDPQPWNLTLSDNPDNRYDPFLQSMAMLLGTLAIQTSMQKNLPKSSI